MTSYFPILAGTFDAMTERCQFAENERPFHRRLPRSLETSEREKGRAPGRGLFCYESLGSATDGRRVSASSGWCGCTYLFCHLPEQIVQVLGKTFLPRFAFTEF